MKSATATIQDDIPPVHVLEAAQNQDRKETEELLAGFDRPGRSPKPVSKERDFVDYYARKKNGGESGPSSGRGADGASRGGAGAGASGSAAAPAIVRQIDVATVIKPRSKDGVWREGTPPWLRWVAVAAAMLAFGGVVAYLATTDSHPTALAPTGASAATTITAATPQQSALDNSIPPPASAEPITTTTANITAEPALAIPATPQPRSSAKRDVRDARDLRASPSVTAGAASHPPSVTGDPKPPPRDDFIRDL